MPVRDDHVSLTAIYKTAMLLPHLRPFIWAKREGRQIIQETVETLGVSEDEVFQNHKGPGIGSWGLSVIASAYREFLDAFIEAERLATAFDDPAERWVAIRDFLGYEVSDFGQVRSYWSTSGGLTERPKLVGAHVKTSGHISVALYRAKSRKPERFAVHRLVLEAFTGLAPDGMEACHNDGNPANNRLENLRWDTRSLNQIDRVRHGRHPQAILTEADIPLIWERLVAGEGPTFIGRDFGVRAAAICGIRTGHSWSHITRNLPGWPIIDPLDNKREPIYVPAEHARLDLEVWKLIPDWDAYRVSNFGRVMTCWKQFTGGVRGEFHLSDEWTERTPSIDTAGYYNFSASKGPGTAKTLKVHRVVLEAFAGPCPRGMVACHNDGNRLNNHAGNLRWDTTKANSRDRFRHAEERDRAVEPMA